MNAVNAYQKLIEALKILHTLRSVQTLLEWDEQVNLPAGAAEKRAEESALISSLAHQELCRPAMGEWLHELESSREALTPAQMTVVRETRRDYDRAVKIPAEFVARKTALCSAAYHAWAEARARSDYARFAPCLTAHLDMAKEEAAFLGFSGNRAYDYFIDLHDPGLNAAVIERLFHELQSELRLLARQILDSPVKPDLNLCKGFPADRQEAFLREVTAAMGFDYQHGRLDRSLHPFCSGNGLDTRLTTRFHEDRPFESLFGAMHEAGHGLYEQGLPREHLANPLGQAVGMAVHESQSRLWENQVGRSRAFWAFWEPKYRKLFAGPLAKITSNQFHLAVNAVRLNPIRTESDEVTYNLHILLRFELEKRLFRGELAVSDLPAAWNELSSDIIGLRPENDAEGVLQDVHWSGGAFGYFPSYCLGNMLAAQLWQAARRGLGGLEEELRQGHYNLLRNWLRREVHQWGRQFNTWDLVKKATGGELSPKALVEYLKERYLTLYT